MMWQSVQLTRIVHRPFYTAISLETPLGAQGSGQPVKDEGRTACEQSFPTTVDSGRPSTFAAAGSVVVLDTGP